MPRVDHSPAERCARGLKPGDDAWPESAYNEVVRQYRDALVRHRRSMLDLNTAVGARVLP